MDLTTVAWVAGGFLCGAGTVAHFTSNALLQLLAEEQPDLWRRLGKPSGVFAPPRGRWSFELHSPVQRWLTETPAWAREYPRALRLLRTMRVAAAVMILGITTLFLVLTLA